MRDETFTTEVAVPIRIPLLSEQLCSYVLTLARTGGAFSCRYGRFVHVFPFHPITAALD
jgi:hypothetical protein